MKRFRQPNMQEWPLDRQARQRFGAPRCRRHPSPRFLPPSPARHAIGPPAPAAPYPAASRNRMFTTVRVQCLGRTQRRVEAAARTRASRCGSRAQRVSGAGFSPRPIGRTLQGPRSTATPAPAPRADSARRAGPSCRVRGRQHLATLVLVARGHHDHVRDAAQVRQVERTVVGPRRRRRPGRPDRAQTSPAGFCIATSWISWS